MHIPVILLGTLLFYLPILINPNILLSRGNDLTEFFWPIIYYVRETLYKHNQLALWNNLFFSGTPLVSDPQSPLFYLPNVIFLVFSNIDQGFLISVFIHILFAGIGMYYLASRGLGFTKLTSLVCALIYLYSPKLSSFVEAGHYGLITSWTWLPFVFLATILLYKKPTLTKALLLSLSLSLIYYSHILIFAIIATSVVTLYFYYLLHDKNAILVRVKYLALAGIMCMALISIGLIPQLSWQGDTTRSLLLNDPDTYPKWLSKSEFIKASTSPLIFGKEFIQKIDTEKGIALGGFVCVVSLLGFISLKVRKNQALIFLTILAITTIATNNISPLYSLLIKQGWYILLRVSTRFWFLAIFLVIYLFAKGLEKLIKRKKLIFLTYALIFATLTELLLTSWTKILTPIHINPNLAPKELYEFLATDNDRFRVFCLNRCLSQKMASIYQLELADGYGTLQQKNYYDYSQQLAQSFWRNRYTLSIPPFEIFNYEKLQPYSPALFDYRVKYVISQHPLKDLNLTLIRRFNNYLVYKNTIYNSPNYLIYSPNFIRVKPEGGLLVIPEVYNKSWKAYLNGTKEVEITQTLQGTRSVEVPKNTMFVDFTYSLW